MPGQRNEAAEGMEATGPSWDDLRIALAVARAQSIARAAENLGVDPATVSRRVAAAEAALGAILFVRSKLGVTLTDAGNALLNRAVEMEARVRRLQEEVAAGGAEGVVRIVTGPWLAACLAADLAPRLRAVHPGILLQLIATRPDWSGLRGEATLSLWFETPPQGGDFAIRLCEVEYALYGLPGTDPEARRAVHFLDDAPRTASSRLGSGAASPDRWARSRATAARPLLSATDSLVLREAARAGLGPALLPVCLGEADPALVRLSSGPPPLVRPLMLHVHPDTMHVARVHAVIDLLRRRAAARFSMSAAPAAGQGAAATPSKLFPVPGP
jgi:DNA-binding transcriptional LysR family regulator